MEQMVLLVDDSPTLRKHAAIALRGGGYRVISACDGMAALEKLSQPENRVDLIITDINMPNLDGYGLIRAVRYTDNQLPIVILSSALGEANRRRGLEAGADAYLTKPFETAVLLAEVNRLLQVSHPNALMEAICDG
jgi:two-component system chemotaxis response regulator CheY